MCHTVYIASPRGKGRRREAREKKKKERKDAYVTMFCKNCGKQLPDDAKFCSGCGTPVNSPIPPQQAQPPAQPPVGPFQIPQAGFPQTEETVPEEAAPLEEAVSEEAAPEEVIFEAASPEEAAPEEAAPGDADPQETPPAAEGSPASTPEQPAPGGAVVPFAAAVPDATGAATAVADPPKRRGRAGLVVLGAGAVVVILAAVLLFKLLSGLGGGGKAAFAYLNEDGELMYLADLKEKTQALELTDEADGSKTTVRFSPDGKTVYFTDSDRSLYHIAVSELKKGGRPERISRDVSSFFLLDDGRLLYSEFNGESKLSLYDGKESFRLIRGYNEYRLSQDQKAIYYTQLDEMDGTLSLYKMALTKDAQEERLLKGASSILTDYDADLLVYTVTDAGSDDVGGNNMTIYSCTPGGDKTKLVSDVYSYSVTGVKSEGGKADFYYYVQDVEKRTLYDFVTDATAEADSATLDAGEPAYPHSYGYSPSDYNILDDTTIEYYTEVDGWHLLNVSSLLSADYPTAYDVYMNTYNIEALAREDAQANYDAAMADYDQRYETWYAAQDREWIRESLKEEQYDQTSYSLYHYTGEGKGDPIATALQFIAPSAPFDGVFLYQKVDVKGGKVADVADLSYAGEVRDLLGSGGGDGPWYQNVGGKESELDLDGVSSIYGVYVLDGKEVVLDLYDEDGVSMLQSFSLGQDALTFTSTIVEDDFAGPYWSRSSGKDALYLFTDVTSDRNYNTAGDLCVYQNGKLETVAQEVYGAYLLDESGATYVISDIDSSDARELALLKDGKPASITDEMEGAPTFLDGGQVLYLADGDLTLWDGKESRRIARDVERVWTSASRPYSAYSPYGDE